MEIDDSDITDSNIIQKLYEHCNIHPERLKIISEIKINSVDETFTRVLDKTLLYLFIFTGNDTSISINSVSPARYKNLFFENSDSLIEIYNANFTLYEISDIIDITQKNIHTSEEITNHIDVFNNLIDPLLCDEIRAYIDNYPNLSTEKWESGQNVNCVYFNLDSLDNSNPMKTYFDTEIFNVIKKVICELVKKYNIEISGDSGYCLRKIYGPTRKHKDGININAIDNRYLPVRKIRNISVIICLNDDYDGSEFYFPMQDYKIKLGKGQIITFPPYWTHPHLTYPLMNGTYRYTINTWLFE